jgi:hypothetical protein
MKAVLLCEDPWHVVTGAILNAFEYFIALYERDQSIKLFLLDGNERLTKKQIDIIEDRCELSDLNYKENIITIPRKDLTSLRFETVLVTDLHTIFKTRGLVIADKIVVVQEKKTHLDAYQYSEKLCNCIYYGEMPFVKKHHEYTMKFLFHRYKEIGESNEGIYVNSPLNEDYSFLKNITLPDKPIIKKSKLNHLKNMFSQFDTYLYYHANKWFDPTPRLFVECYYYGKKIHYYNEPNIIDGSFYRYHDVMNNGIDHRYFSDEDEVLREVLK